MKKLNVYYNRNEKDFEMMNEHIFLRKTDGFHFYINNVEQDYQEIMDKLVECRNFSMFEDRVLIPMKPGWPDCEFYIEGKYIRTCGIVY